MLWLLSKKDPYRIDYGRNYIGMYKVRILSPRNLPEYDYHITHKFFGEDITEEQAAKVLQIMDEYWGVNGVPVLEGEQQVFGKDEWFGEEKDTHVLRPSDSTVDTLLQQKALKTQLDAIRPDDFDTYKPHLTMPDEEIHSVTLAIIGYNYKCGDELLKEWKAGVGNTVRQSRLIRRSR
jgi:hypothetical protein